MFKQVSLDFALSVTATLLGTGPKCLAGEFVVTGVDQYGDPVRDADFEEWLIEFEGQAVERNFA